MTHTIQVEYQGAIITIATSIKNATPAMVEEITEIVQSSSEGLEEACKLHNAVLTVKTEL